jgi:hypothetical protein
MLVANALLARAWSLQRESSSAGKASEGRNQRIEKVSKNVTRLHSRVIDKKG